MQAIILAAGMGKRLKNLTKDNTKCMVKVNGITLIERMLKQLDTRKLSKIVIVTGYKGKELKKFISTLEIKTKIVYVKNNVYDTTNNIYSLALAKKYLEKEDTLLFESDLIFEDSVIDELLNDEYDTLALVDKYESWMDGTCVKISQDNKIEAFIPGKNFKFEEIKDYYKTVNIYKFSKQFSKTHYVPFLEAYCKALGNNEYYEQVLRVLSMLDDSGIKAKKLNGQLWYEIDDIQDLDIASSMFSNSQEEKLLALQKRYGGYWRYPKLIDFCYLVNPYFPPKKLTDEIKANFEVLLTQYPSGMTVNSLLASKDFNVDIENIVIGNGAAELIKSCLKHIKGKIGIIIPTFEEYPNRYIKQNIVKFKPSKNGFRYTAKDIVNYFNDKSINNLIIINPDNPSGNYLSKKEILYLINWTKNKNIRLIVDESFVDFATEENATIIDKEIINNNSHLIVVKSISKSYGVPGLRLGILISGNKDLIKELKKDVSIWNINSFAEFYMQISEKYTKDYKIGLKKIKEERARFVAELSKIKLLNIFPSQANYLMIEIKNKVSSRKLTKLLLDKYQILIKDLSSKIKDSKKQYIRIAVRNTDDNNKLLVALRNIFKEIK